MKEAAPAGPISRPGPVDETPALLARIEALQARVRELERGPPAGGAAAQDGAAADRPMRAMADAVPAMLWITDDANRTTLLSRGWYEYTGQSEAEGLGFGWLDAVHPDDRDATRARFLEAAVARRSFSLDHRLRRVDGAYRWVLDEGRPRFGDHGEWLGYAGAVVDVHDAGSSCRRSARARRATARSSSRSTTASASSR